MTKAVLLLLAAASVGLALGLAAPAVTLAALQDTGGAPCAGTVCAVRLGKDGRPMPPVEVSGEEDDDHDDGWFRWGRDHDDEDDDGDDDECEDDDDDDGCRGSGGKGNSAPAGTAAPPANGLFGNGAPPRAVTN